MCDLLETAQTQRSCSWVLSSGPMSPFLDERGVQVDCRPLGGRFSNSACFLEAGSVGHCSWGCMALRCPGFLLKLCLSSSLPATRMGSCCAAVSCPVGYTHPQCLHFAPGDK